MGEELDLPWCFEDEHIAWQKTVAEFCTRVVAPEVVNRDLAGQLDPDLIREVGRLGAFGLRVPEAYGGSGADLRSMCIAAEEFSVLDSSLAVTVHVQAIAAVLFHHLADDDLRAEFLPGMATGETFCAFGLTEPSGGSDAGNIGTVAVRSGSDWIINGAKQFITNSGTPFSKYVILFAAHEGEVGPAGGRAPISAFLVPLDAPGVSIGPKYPKMGWRSSDTHPLYFDDVRIPAHHLLGQEGRGYREALAFLTWARIPIAAMAAGLAPHLPPGGGLRHRRPVGHDRHLPAPDLRRRLEVRHGPPDRARSGRLEADGIGTGQSGRLQGQPSAWRLWLHGRLPCGPSLP
jgi:short/branched chain acyl-CoA dehydrogenase